MAEVKALDRHSCPECGGDAVWNPSRQAIACPYCGTIVPGQPKADGTGIQEHDLAAALRQIGDDKRGWQDQKTSVQCQNCHAISVFDAGRVAQRCDFCGSPSIVPYQEARDPIRPESLLPFKLAEADVRDRMRRWYATRWFAPNRLKSAALTDTLKGLYLPYWTFDAHASAHWTAESGYYYYVTESYRDPQGRTQTRRVRKIRWQSSSGSLEHFFDDTLVQGSTGVNHALLTGIEPFPTNELVTYEASYIRGWVVERYQIDLTQAAQSSREKMDAELYQMCSRQVPGDTHRNLQVNATYSARTFKHVLLPVWLVSYTYGPRVFQVVANGFTGAIAGQRPYSWVKITLVALAALAVVGTIVLLYAMNQ